MYNHRWWHCYGRRWDQHRLGGLQLFCWNGSKQRPHIPTANPSAQDRSYQTVRVNLSSPVGSWVTATRCAWHNTVPCHPAIEPSILQYPHPLCFCPYPKGLTCFLVFLPHRNGAPTFPFCWRNRELNSSYLLLIPSINFYCGTFSKVNNIYIFFWLCSPRV